MGVALMGILSGEDLTLLGKANRTCERGGRQGAKEPVSRSGATADGAASAMEALDRGACFLADCRDSFERTMNPPLAGKNPGILVTVGVADHGGLN